MMNERIKELAVLSGFDIDTNVSFAEKTRLDCFAELLIRECAKIALSSGNITNKSEQAKAEAQRIYHKIQEHFGVEWCLKRNKQKSLTML